MTDEQKYERGVFDWKGAGDVLTIQPQKAGATLIVRQGDTMASISAEGEITIDWHVVEQAATDPAFPNPWVSAIAHLLLAVRDQTYKGIWKPNR